MGWTDLVLELTPTGLEILKSHKGGGGKDAKTRIIFGARLMQIRAALKGVKGAEAASALALETLRGLGHAKAIKSAYAAVKAAQGGDDEDFDSML